MPGQNHLNILLIEDDPIFRIALRDALYNYGVVSEAETVQEALELHRSQHFNLILVDLNLKGGDSGLDFLKQINAQTEHVIVLSSMVDDSVTEEAYRLGCSHFLSKRHFKKNLDQYIRLFTLPNQEEVVNQFLKTKFISQSPDLVARIHNLARYQLKGKSLFIRGETGVGKSLLGELICELHFDSKAPFIHINCSEIPENLIESELFGHKKGSFTGATADKKGLLELASGGVLFLDEIATMPLIMQKKLLKAIETKTFYPVGSQNEVRSNFTLVSATCEDIDLMIEQGLFRQDLFYRIAHFQITIPPLRERPGDIRPLIQHFKNLAPRRFVLKEGAISEMERAFWKGNTRELKSVVSLLAEDTKGIIEISDLPEYALSDSESREDTKHSGSEFEQVQKFGKWLTSKQFDYIMEHGLRNFVKNIEQDVATQVLEMNEGKVAKSIKDLKVSSSAFYRMIGR